MVKCLFMTSTHRLRLHAFSWSSSLSLPKLLHMHDLIAADNRLETVEPATPLCYRSEQQAWIHKLSSLRFPNGICPDSEALAILQMCCRNLHCETQLIQSFRLVLLPTAPKICASAIQESGLDHIVGGCSSIYVFPITASMHFCGLLLY